jgi:hypothetical protein
MTSDGPCREKESLAPALLPTLLGDRNASMVQPYTATSMLRAGGDPKKGNSGRNGIDTVAGVGSNKNSGEDRGDVSAEK